ncbi:MAG: hypothetical protein K9M02_11695 [Thiohalocapsa sp.]|nr:hypothetical protein [Thiohalocapsa sp.]
MRLVLSSGAGLVVGCAKGADAAAIEVAVSGGAAGRLHILCAFGPVASLEEADRTPGICASSAPRAVALAAAAGARVVPWAGGPAPLPVRARLARRTAAVAAACTAGAVVLLRAQSRGSLLLARSVAKRGLPVLAVPVDCAAADLPLLGQGRWAEDRARLLGPGLLRWEPAQSVHVMRCI